MTNRQLRDATASTATATPTVGRMAITYPLTKTPPVKDEREF